MRFLGGKGGYFEKLSKGSKTSDMTSEGLGEVFEGDSADISAGKFPLVSMGGQANGQACADGERGHPSARAEILSKLKIFNLCCQKLFVGSARMTNSHIEVLQVSKL
jgi:hypothetical protein